MSVIKSTEVKIMNAITDGAQQESIRSQLPGRLDGPADAYRHILASATLVWKGYPEGLVRKLGFLNEYFEEKDSPDSSDMDLHNNDIGFKIGKEVREAGGTIEDVRKKVREAIGEGYKNGGKEMPDDPDSPIWLSESQWKNNPLNDDTKEDKNDRLPTDQTNWPPKWLEDGQRSPEHPKWWHDEKGGEGGGATDPADDGNRGFNLGFPRDPFVLDLDGDGIELGTLADSQAYFDLNGDGFATRTSWLKGDDGFLALDRNQDGKINDITELFGSPDRTGYEELSELDSNADGVIDKADERFAELLVWQDVNEDGISQADELKPLTEAGIVSISLTHESVTDQQGDGQLARRGSFTWKDGTQGTAGETPGIAADVLFAQHPTFS